MLEHRIPKVKEDFPPGRMQALLGRLPALRVDRWLWLKNGYEPRVEVRLCWSDRFLYVHFRVEEPEVRLRYRRFQDPVYKDSCVEMFIDPFPEKRRGYVNIETNALGTVLAAFGKGATGRLPFAAGQLREMEVQASISRPVDGPHGAPFWTLAYRFPLSVFKLCYSETIREGRRGRANFFKCGDETAVPHYGAWSPVDVPAPDFHRPEFFGTVVFEKA
jgi:hypothetical protein